MWTAKEPRAVRPQQVAISERSDRLAMSVQAQAEWERQARLNLADPKKLVAEKFGEAAKTRKRATA